MPDVMKMLTLSTAHISESTAKALEQDPETNELGLAVYPKCTGQEPDAERFGWFIYLNREIDEGLPDDLKQALRYARDRDCQILCLDCDGPEEPELNTYDW